MHFEAVTAQNDIQCLILQVVFRMIWTMMDNSMNDVMWKKVSIAAQVLAEIDCIQAWWLPWQYVSIKPDGLYDNIDCMHIVTCISYQACMANLCLTCVHQANVAMACASYQAWMATPCWLGCMWHFFVSAGVNMKTWLGLRICICYFVSSIVSGRSSISQWEWYGATYKHADVGASYLLVHSFGATCGVHMCMEFLAWFHLCWFLFHHWASFRSDCLQKIESVICAHLFVLFCLVCGL